MRGFALKTDKTRIALVFARGPIDKVVLTSVSSTRDLDIPPGEANYEAKGKPFVFDQDSHIVSLLPRMNERMLFPCSLMPASDADCPVLLSPDGTRYAVAHESTVRVVDLRTGRSTGSLNAVPVACAASRARPRMERQ